MNALVSSPSWRHLAFVRIVAVSMTLATALASAPFSPAAAAPTKTYTNPLRVTIPGGGQVESCADPAMLSAQSTGDGYWYMYCTTDPLNGADKTGNDFNFHLIPMLRSSDLVNWTYMGDAFAAKPAWVHPGAGLWAPEVQHFNGQYYLYYTASDTTLPGGGSAIGVATSPSPVGPWTDSGTPAVEPHGADCCGPDSRRWVFDPDIVEHEGQRYIFYGSYFGGLSARQLSADGLTSNLATQTNVAISNRYEGTEIVRHDGYFYLFASATDCCRGPLTGYSVFVGRSTNPLGPYVDRDGSSFLAGRVGGTPALTMNGNRWVGTGHNSVFQDFAGQTWTAYHAVDRFDPYFDGAVGFTKRPVLLDPVDWIGGWPTIRGGQWASDKAVPRPAAQPASAGAYQPTAPPAQTVRQLLDGDEFNGAIDADWSWVREPATGTGLAGGTFNFDTQAADLFVDSNNASVLTRPLPAGNWVAETKVRLNLPAEGCCFNYVQAGLVVYGDDDNFLKLAHVSIWETRQTEWAKELSPVPDGYPRYGNTVVSAPGEWTWLRIARWETGDEVHYQAFTRQDGKEWNAGGVWTHAMSAPSIGLVSMGGSGFTANFDYLRIYRLQVESSNRKN